MKEYTLYLRHGNGKPFNLGYYNSLESAKMKLYDIIQLEIERNRAFFVDNDFFDNKYNVITSKTFYICILEREVTEWEKTESKENSTFCNNIKYLYKF